MGRGKEVVIFVNQLAFCSRRVYHKRHSHRNEGAEDVVVYATFMLPEGGAPRIDVENPGVCPF